MRLSEILLGSVVLLLSSVALGDAQPVCRWLELDETRVLQCAVMPETITEVAPTLSDGLPDPTRPLAEQLPQISGNKSVSVDLVQITPSKTQYRAEFVASESTLIKSKQNRSISKFMVLGSGDPAAIKRQLTAKGDQDFVLLSSRNRLSLGVFSSEANARSRQATLRGLGIETSVEVLGGSGTPPITLATIEKSEPKAKPVNAPELRSKNYVTTNLNETLDLENIASRSTKVSNNNEMSQMGYIVASLGESSTVLRKLQALLDNDYAVVRSGPYKDRISVGVYSSVQNAYARQDYFQQRGIHSEVIARGSEAVLRSTLQDQQDRDYPQIALIPLDI